MQTKKQGFTLIELLVVIVIIGILATIAIPQFSSYFAKARDSERKASVSNIATLIKVNMATADTIDYTLANKAALDTILAGQGYSTPISKSGYTYSYIGNATDFAVTACSEEDNNNEIQAGTVNAMAAVTCTDGDADTKVPDLAASGAPFVYTMSEIIW